MLSLPPGIPESLDEVLDKLLAATWKAKPALGLAANGSAPAQVRATALAKLTELRTWLAAQHSPDSTPAAFFPFGAAQIKRFQDDPKEIGLPRPPAPPPGMPIGDDECGFVVH